jgi:hypothetical protein
MIVFGASGDTTTAWRCSVGLLAYAGTIIVTGMMN